MAEAEVETRRKYLDVMERVLGPRFRRVPEYMQGGAPAARAALRPEEEGVGFDFDWEAEEEEDEEDDEEEEPAAEDEDEREEFMFEVPRFPSGIGTRFA